MKEIMNKEQILRTLKRMTHEIIERNQKVEDLVFVAILNKGLSIGNLLQTYFKQFTGHAVLLVPIDIGFYRDDEKKTAMKSDISADFRNKVVILIDDVLYTGRSVRAALDLISEKGRPRKIELAILVDRGHRELPIRADYVGKNVPTSQHETILVDLKDYTVKII